MSETMKTVDICPTAAKGLREAATGLIAGGTMFCGSDGGQL